METIVLICYYSLNVHVKETMLRTQAYTLKWKLWNLIYLETIFTTEYISFILSENISYLLLFNFFKAREVQTGFLIPSHRLARNSPCDPGWPKRFTQQSSCLSLRSAKTPGARHTAPRLVLVAHP